MTSRRICLYERMVIMAETMGDRVPHALKRVGQWLGMDIAAKVPVQFYEDIMALHAAASEWVKYKNAGGLPRSEDVELAIRANNMGGTEFRDELCQCDASVGNSPCPYCAVDTVLIRLLRCVDPHAAEKSRPKKAI
jgi:hypothetical protein